MIRQESTVSAYRQEFVFLQLHLEGISEEFLMAVFVCEGLKGADPSRTHSDNTPRGDRKSKEDRTENFCSSPNGQGLAT